MDELLVVDYVGLTRLQVWAPALNTSGIITEQALGQFPTMTE
jgi:hypothetical protein